ncbi:MAG: hypothetical protein OEV14_11455, partial [Gammaproteobacteria bacterium]|nr:hypothetical protein [Gammaproteobacteria bacterium]
ILTGGRHADLPARIVLSHLASFPTTVSFGKVRWPSPPKISWKYILAMRRGVSITLSSLRSSPG